MKIAPRTVMAVVVAVIALVLSAGAGATASLLITGKQIRNNTVTSADIKNRTLKAKDLSRGAKSKLRGPAGVAGPQGPAGPAGPAGLIGLPGLSGFEVVTQSLPIPAGLTTVTTPVTAACPAGKKALSATAALSNPVVGLVTQVSRVSDTAFEAVGVPDVTALLGTNTLDLEVVCATVAG